MSKNLPQTYLVLPITDQPDTYSEPMDEPVGS
jgi:hypothetical protein